MCDDTEFEFTSCTSTLDRQCRNKQMLASPEVSDNMLFEDLRRVRADVSRHLQLVDVHSGKLASVIQLDRGMDLSINS